MSVGSEDSVDLQATNIARFVGGWIIDIEYDADIVSVAECVPIENGIRDLQFDAGTIRVSGASVTGLTKDTTLAVLTFRCENQGDSPLSLDLQGGSGIPEIIVEAETLHGNITCERPSEATVTGDDAATPTAPPSLPATGVRDRLLLGAVLAYPLSPLAKPDIRWGSGLYVWQGNVMHCILQLPRRWESRYGGGLQAACQSTLCRTSPAVRWASCGCVFLLPSGMTFATGTALLQ